MQHRLAVILLALAALAVAAYVVGRGEAVAGLIRDLHDRMELALDRETTKEVSVIMSPLQTCWHYEIAPGIVAQFTVTTHWEGEGDTIEKQLARHQARVNAALAHYPAVETPNARK